MDGVLTRTADVHSTAWQRMFDEYLQRRAARNGEPFRPFVHATDYLACVDGKPRYHGVAAFLAARGITLPWGGPDDAPGDETVCGLGNRKNVLFHEIVARDGVAVFDSTVRLVRTLRAAGLRVGLATSSRNATAILSRTGTADLFPTVVDGLVSAQLGLKGKPAPDIFAIACAALEVARDRAIVVEDAVSGVQAGARGGFALTVGIARDHNAAELRRHGADLVVGDLAETNLAQLDLLVRAKRARGELPPPSP